MFNQYTYQSIGALNRQMEVMGDAVSDINNSFTKGYKSKRTTFHETVNGLRRSETRDFQDGMGAKTGRGLDFAIEGEGFFEIELPDGTKAYTRNGSFKVGPNGELVNGSGYPVVTTNPDNEYVTMNSSGESKSFDVGVNSASTFIPIGESVVLDQEGVLKTARGKLIGKLSVVNFRNKDGLQDIGDNLYLATEDSGFIDDAEIGPMTGQTKIRQGYLENSNVSLVNSMSDLVQLNTSVKTEMKVIKLMDQMQESLTSTITRNL